MILSSCNSQPITEVSTILVEDQKPTGTASERNHEKTDDSAVFKIWSEEIVINQMNCYWEYEVQLADEADTGSKLVSIISQKLVGVDTKIVALDFDLSLLDDMQPVQQSDLNYAGYQYQVVDINFDGQTDIQFTDRVQGGANHNYFVYVFQPKTSRFEFSEVMSGGSFAAEGIVLNQKQKVAWYSSKAGGGLYFFKKIYFKEGQILFYEIFTNDILISDLSPNESKSIYCCRKYKGGKLVEERSDTIFNTEGDFNGSQFFEWVGYETK